MPDGLFSILMLLCETVYILCIAFCSVFQTSSNLVNRILQALQEVVMHFSCSKYYIKETASLFNVWHFAEDTQDPLEDELQLNRIKDWIISSISETVGFLDVLANFPDISRVISVSLNHKTCIQ